MKIIFLGLVMCLGTARSVEPFLRIQDGGGGTRILEIAVRTLRAPNDAPLRIHLVGVSHIGTQAYYDALQALLDGMDLVLFEGVGGDREEFLQRDPEADAEELQPALARALGLRFQLHAMDYGRPHFVNSDLSPGELMAFFSGQSPGDFTREGLARLEATMSAIQGQGLEADLSRLFLGMMSRHPPFALGVRWALVEILGAVRGDLAAVQGLPEDVSQLFRVLLRERNAVVIADLARLMDRPAPPRNVAVFYGAAHMHELQKRLTRDFEFQVEDSLWLPAFQGNLARSGLGQIQQNLLRHLVAQQAALLGALGNM